MAEAQGHIVIRRKAKDGKDGKRGAILRGPQLWKDIPTGFSFEAGGENDTYLDIMTINRAIYYKCKVSHNKPNSNPTQQYLSNYWESYPKVGLVATRALVTDAIVMTDDNENILFKAENGVVECNTGEFKDVIITGTQRSPFKFSDGYWGINDIVMNDNVIVAGSPTRFSVSYELPTGIENSGRTIRIINAKSASDNGPVYGVAYIGGLWFNEGSKHIPLEAGCGIEALGVGDGNSFLGWVITNKFGAFGYNRLNILAYGSVKNSYDDYPNRLDFEHYSTIGDLSLTKLDTGKYKILLTDDNMIFSELTDMRVLLTPLGETKGRNWDTLCTLTERAADYFVVQTLDVGGAADGSFDFYIMM